MPVVFDEVVANVEPERPATQTEPARTGSSRRPPAEELRRQLRLIERRQARLRAD